MGTYLIVLCLFLLSFVPAGQLKAADKSNAYEYEKFYQSRGAISEEEILVVQPIYFKKSGRHEITPLIVGGTPFDAVKKSLMGGFAYSYHFTDTISVEPVYFGYFRSFGTSFVKNLYKNYNVSADVLTWTYLVAASVVWAPFYGKFSFFNQLVTHYDIYFLASGGLTVTEVSVNPAFGGGIGFRIALNKWLSMKLELRDYVLRFNKSDFNAALYGQYKNQFLISLGMSVSFPKFDVYLD